MIGYDELKGGSVATQTPVKSSGLISFDELKGTPASASTPAPTPSPQNIGTGYGASNLKDTSGKPLLTFENQNLQASQLLSDRVAPTFDFTKAQKLTPDMLQNGRMPESVSQSIKTSLGGNSSQELDHRIALELSGSNQSSNLGLEPNIPGTKNTATDPLENTLAKRVVKGEISLLDSHRMLAKAKGYTLAEDQTPEQFNPAPKPSGQEVAFKTFPSTMQTLGELQENPLSLGKSISEILSTPFTEPKQAADAFNKTLNTFVHSLRSNDSASQKINNGLETAVAFGSAALSPITSWFSAASKIPIIGSISKLIFNLPFAVVGDMSGNTGVSALNALPLPQGTKDTLEPGIKAISTLAGQIIAGKSALDISGMVKELTPKFGAKDAQTIVEKAQEIAQEQKAPQTESKSTLQDLATKPEVKKSESTTSQVSQPKPEAKPTALEPLATETTQTLRGAKGLSAEDIMSKHPDIQLKRDVPATDVYGKKITIPEGEALTPYELKGNKVLLQDGETYIVSKSQFQNIKGNASEAVAKPFAPELKGLEESVRGKSIKESTTPFYKEMEKKYGTGITMAKIKEISPADYKRWETITEKASENVPKYSSYQLPEGKNYKEILIKAPTKNEINPWTGERKYMSPNLDFKSSHWDEPNVISHLRLNERTYKGKKVTFMEELQSDWAREGRSKGFASEPALPTNLERFKNGNVYSVKVPGDDFQFNGKSYAEAEQRFLDQQKSNQKFNGSVPNNPLLKNWQELSVKRALQEAVNNKSEYFSWINGEQTSARYNLATQVEKVDWREGVGKIGSGNKTVALTPKAGATRQLDILIDIDKSGKIFDGGGDMPSEWQGKKLDEVLGKGLADKIMEKESGTLSGEGLKFGGEWANNLYDKQVGNIVKDLTGAKVETMDMGLPIKGKSSVYSVRDAISKKDLTSKDLKIGQRVDVYGEQHYMIVSKKLGGNKFEAYDAYEWNQDKVKNKQVFEIKEISTKTTTQQGIKLTPEIRAIIKGEAPKIEASGKSPLTQPKPKGIEKGLVQATGKEVPKSSEINPQAGFIKPSELIPRPIKEVGSEIKSGASPQFTSPKATVSADIVRNAKADIANASAIERLKYKDVSKSFDKASDAENIGNISEYEKTGQFKNAPEGYSDFYKKSTEASRSILQKVYGNDRVGYVENYVRRAFEFGSKADEEKGTAYLTNKIGSLSASKSNIKGRVLDMPLDEALADMKERGINVKPASTNPEVLRQWSVENANQALKYKEAWDSAKEKGLVPFVKMGDRVPEDKVALNDRVAKVFFPSEKGMVQAGQYYADKNVARIFNNAISKGLGDSPTFKGIRAINNAYNQFQLGFSGFHAIGTAINSSISDLALGARQILNGNFGAGLKSTGKALVPTYSFASNLFKGKGFLADLVKGDPEAQKILEERVNPAGARLRVEQQYTNASYKNMMQAWKDAGAATKEGNYVEAGNRALAGAARIPLAVVQKVAEPLMSYAIPRVKMGAFLNLAEATLEKLPEDVTPEARSRALAESWDSIDNRFGQLVYDNLFWNKTVTDLAQVSTRSVGWNLGTVRELGGGLSDIVTKTARGKGISDRTLYTMMLPIYVGTLGAVYQYLHTGQKPSELKDYFYPKNGLTDKNGNPDRSSLPTYMKDVYAYSTDPLGTVAHKESPLASLITELATNRNYYGDMVRNPDDPKSKQLQQIGLEALNQFLPFTVQNLNKIIQEKGGGARNIEPFLGVNKAPAGITQSATQKAGNAAITQKRGAFAPRTPEQVDVANQKADARTASAKGDNSKLDALIKVGIISPKTRSKFIKDSKLTPYQRSLQSLPKNQRQQYAQ